MARRRPTNTQDIPIYICPHTSTQAGSAYPSNQNQQYILQHISNNQQQQLRSLPHPVANPLGLQHWWSQHTSPSDPTSSNSLYRQNPRALITAQNTQYSPQGQPINEIPRPWGYQLEGEWHIVYMNQQLQRQQQRPNPDVNPMWARDHLRLMDQLYRQRGYTVPGTTWPSQPVIQAIENSGIHICNIDRNGYVQWIWQGRQ